jgi:hypothetical protein
VKIGDIDVEIDVESGAMSRGVVWGDRDPEVGVGAGVGGDVGVDVGAVGSGGGVGASSIGWPHAASTANENVAATPRVCL